MTGESRWFGFIKTKISENAIRKHVCCFVPKFGKPVQKNDLTLKLGALTKKFIIIFFQASLNVFLAQMSLNVGNGDLALLVGGLFQCGDVQNTVSMKNKCTNDDKRSDKVCYCIFHPNGWENS